MSASLGGLLKDYRLQKNISQMEIAFDLGWKEPSRLSRIEQGRVGNPPRKTLDKIIKAMRLKEEEKSHLLLVGNYAPTDNEIKRFIASNSNVVDDWPYPATIYDFRWRVIYINKPSKEIYQKNKIISKLAEKYPNTIETYFHPEYVQNKHYKGKELQNWRDFLVTTLSQFKNSQSTRAKEKWFVDLMQKMMRNDLFRELWQQAQEYKSTRTSAIYDTESVVNPKNKNKRLIFHFFLLPDLNDSRFQIEFHTPADSETMDYYNRKNNKK
jgi:transcriptional regulator with XRE-family HTH domain